MPSTPLERSLKSDQKNTTYRVTGGGRAVPKRFQRVPALSPEDLQILDFFDSIKEI
jgi:hypothetical protein